MSVPVPQPGQPPPQQVLTLERVNSEVQSGCKMDESSETSDCCLPKNVGPEAVIKTCKRLRSFKDEDDEDDKPSLKETTQINEDMTGLRGANITSIGVPASANNDEECGLMGQFSSHLQHQSKKAKNDIPTTNLENSNSLPQQPGNKVVPSIRDPVVVQQMCQLKPTPVGCDKPGGSVSLGVVTGGVEGDLSEEDDDDDYDDLSGDEGECCDNADFLDGAEDDDLDGGGGDVMMEDDDTKSNTSSTFSTGSSVGSNTPSLVGENLEAVCLAESGGGGGGDPSVATGTAGGKDAVTAGAKKGPFGVAMGPLIQSPLGPLRRSLFSNVPPTINFVHHNEVSETPLPAEVRKHLRWRLSNITPAVIKRIVTNSGFRLMRKSCSSDWGGCWGKHMKSPMFKDLNETQKLNHFPGTFNIGRKDRLWKNYHRLRLKFGRQEFSFLPRTFLLPAETKLLKRVWERKGPRAKWIVKPPALARGNGIKVVNKWSQIPKCRPLIVQKYVAKPHLINDTKYDLRIYVLLTSLSPLRIFLYDDGLVRFASNAYSSDANSLSDVFTHLTNYSINKNSSTYQANEDSESRSGHKWTLSSLWAHFAERGVDSKPVMDSIKDLIIKTVVSAEASMHAVYRPNLSSHYCGYELFGFDVLLDSKLKPWLIEVNISPSLHSSSPLDLDVKSPLATEVFNLARFHIPPAKMSMKTQRDILEQLNMTSSSQLCMDRRLYARGLSKSERAKQDKFLSIYNSIGAYAAETGGGSGGGGAGDNGQGVDEGARRSLYLESILESLTPDDVRFLIRAEDELAQATHFTRIFPTRDTHKYFKYFETPRYYNLLFDAWETKYADDNLRAAAIDRLERLCVSKFHLKVPTIISKKVSTAVSSGNEGSSASGARLDQVKAEEKPRHLVKKKGPVVADVSMLKGPTGVSAATFKTNDSVCPGPSDNHPDTIQPQALTESGSQLRTCPNPVASVGVGATVVSSCSPPDHADSAASISRLTPPQSPATATKVKVSNISISAKRHSVGKTPLARKCQPSTVGLGRSKSGSPSSPPLPPAEPMFTDETPMTSASDKSRSPSPPPPATTDSAAHQDQQINQDVRNDNTLAVATPQYGGSGASRDYQALDNQKLPLPEIISQSQNSTGAATSQYSQKVIVNDNQKVIFSDQTEEAMLDQFQ